METKDKNDTIRSLDFITIDSDPSELVKVFGPRFEKAWSILEGRKIVRYVFHPSGRVRWIVEGKKRDYLILSATRYCDCLDFLHGIVYGKALACQHLITQRLAEVLGDYTIREVDDSRFDQLMNDWRSNATTYDHTPDPPRAPQELLTYNYSSLGLISFYEEMKRRNFLPREVKEWLTDMKIAGLITLSEDTVGLPKEGVT